MAAVLPQSRLFDEAGALASRRHCQGVTARGQGRWSSTTTVSLRQRWHEEAAGSGSWQPLFKRLAGVGGGVLLAQQTAAGKSRGTTRRRAALGRLAGAAAEVAIDGSSHSRGSTKEEEAIESLLRWLESHGTRGLNGLRVARSDVPERGLAVYAARDFEPQEEFCFVPASAIISGEQPLESGALNTPLNADVPDEVREAATHDYVSLAAALLRERHLGAESRFAPYLALLPEWSDLAPMHPIHWSEIDGINADELLEGSSKGRRLEEEALKEIAKHVEALVASGAAADEREAKWASLIVNTRCFTFRSGVALIPLLDILNTFSTSEETEDEEEDEDDVNIPETEWHAAFDSTDALGGTGGRMLTERQIRTGEEVVHLYNMHCTAYLWMLYGFVPPSGENPFEAAAITVDLLQSDSILAAEFDEAFVEVACKALVDAGVSLRGRTLHFNLPEDAEAGGLLMPVARVFACRDARKVPEIAAHIPSPESRRPQQDKVSSGSDEAASGRLVKNLGIQLELEARTLVLDWLQTELRRSTAASKRLDSLLASTSSGAEERDAAKKKELRLMARRLVECERPVIEFEAKVQEEFCEKVQHLGLRPWAPPLQSIDRKALAKLQYERWDDVQGWMGGG